MNPRILLPTLIALSLYILSSTTAAPVIDAEAARKLDDLVNSQIAKHITPSCCIVIGTGNQVLYSKAYGHYTYDPTSPAVTLDTMYDMASCSKAVGTASAFALLLQDGKVKLDDAVSKYLPSWNRDDKRTITLRNLVTHTSGLPSYTSASGAQAGRKPGDTSADALINHIASLPLQYKTNEGHLYACLNFLTLARVNEEVARTNQEALLRKRVFESLGMSSTGYYITDAQKKLCAPTLTSLQGEVHDPLANYYRDGYHCPGNAGLFTTANDLTRFCQMILCNGRYGHKRFFRQRRIFAPQTVDMFFTNQAPADPKYAWGLGWGMNSNRAPSEKRGPKTACISHTGYTGTMVQFDRYAGTFMIILTNRVYPDDSTDVGRLRSGIRRIVMDTDPVYKSAQAQSPAPTPPPAPHP